MAAYLRATDRASVADAVEPLRQEYLSADPGAQYDRVVELDLSALEPHISTAARSRPPSSSCADLWGVWRGRRTDGPFSPDVAHPLSQFASAVHKNRWPEAWKVCATRPPTREGPKTGR